MKCEICGQVRADVEPRVFGNRITFISCIPCVRNIEQEADIQLTKLVDGIRDSISQRLQMEADERIKK